MILVAGTVRIPPEKMQEYRGHAAAVIAATRQESGCQVCSFAEDVLEPGLIRIFEIWQSRGHLDAHLQAPHMIPWRAALAEIGASGRDIRVYEAAGGDPV